jgi:RNA polymerase sigma factor (sigma-70 family)
MTACLAHPRTAPAWPGLARSRHNPRVNSFFALEIQTPLAPERPESEASALESLIKRMAQGEAQAMAELYDATIRSVYSLVRRFAPDDASAQDVTQDVYLQAWQQAQRFDSSRGVAMAWLLNLARSRALDAWRKLASSPILANSDVADVAASELAEALQPTDFLEAADRKALLHTALQSLPAATRQMLSLAFFHDMSHAEISAHLHMPLGTVKSTLRRALLSLREHLQASGMPAARCAALEIEDTP